MKQIVTKSRYFSRVAETKSVDVDTDPTSLAGVRVAERGNKKGTELELFLPRGGKNVRLSLSGRQANSIFRTLERHYARTGRV